MKKKESISNSMAVEKYTNRDYISLYRCAYFKNKHITRAISLPADHIIRNALNATEHQSSILSLILVSFFGVFFSVYFISLVLSFGVSLSLSLSPSAAVFPISSYSMCTSLFVLRFFFSFFLFLPPKKITCIQKSVSHTHSTYIRLKTLYCSLCAIVATGKMP